MIRRPVLALAVFWLCAPACALAAAPAGAPGTKAAAAAGTAAAAKPEAAPAPKDVLLAALHYALKWLAANPFIVAMIFLVLAALVGVIISRRIGDRVLCDFQGYPVTLELDDGSVYHGELDVEKTGLEFHYEKTTPQDGPTKTSFIIYKPEYDTVHALLRYPDRLNDKQLEARQKAAARAYHPNVFRRARRRVRNFLAGAKDSVTEAFGLVMGQAKGIQAAAPVMKSGGKYIDQVGKQTIGTAADVAYDPLLEKQIGLRVVLELPQDTAVQAQCVGTFREYTREFFELMDVDYEGAWEIALPTVGTAAFVRGIAAQRTPDGLVVENCNTFDVRLAEAATVAEGDGEAAAPRPLAGVPVIVSSGAELEFAVTPDAGRATLKFTTRRTADLIVPRSGAFVRHKNEWVEPKKLIGSLQEAVGLLPGTQHVVAVLRQGAELVTGPSATRAIPFVKMHGCGNDYIYVDCRDRVIADPAALARRASDRHFGVGGDGLILVCRSQRADYRMRMFNVDGSEAQMCGNGLRCFVKYLYDRGLLDGEEARIETGAGVLTVRVFPRDGKAERLRIDLGKPRLERAEIPMAGPDGKVLDEELTIEPPGGPVTLRLTAVSMGNPHAVTYVDDTDGYPVAAHGPLVENHPAFPERTNAEFVQIVNRGEVKMRVWERGCGETLACGTGAAAVCVAGVLTDRTDRKLLVHLLGGDPALAWAPHGAVHHTGPATEVFEGMLRA